MNEGKSTPWGPEVGKTLVELALEIGFDLAAIAPLEPPPDAERFDAWLARGYAGDMDWLARGRDRIVDPRGLAEGGASLLVVGLAHSREPVELEGGGRIARYATGRDYHNRVGKLLKRLRRALAAEGCLPRGGASMCDAAPLLERSHATAAGLGFPSKAANLLHPTYGPWFFLGELVVEGVAPPPLAPPPGSCGTCTACIDACPTDAIRGPGEVDARLCISYQTIEQRGPVPHDLREAVAAWGFGCDICSEVCPWGRKAPDRGADWGTHAGLEGGARAWLETPEEAFAERWNGSALRRPGRAGLARNAALVLGLARPDGAREWLRAALEADAAPLVREAAAWGLARGFGHEAQVRTWLEAALEREADPAWRNLLARDLELALSGRSS